MAAPRPLPGELAGTCFTRAEAHRAGMSDAMLRGSRIVTVHKGVYRYADTAPTFELLARAALLVAPPDAALSHLTALRWWGLSMGRTTPIHVATTTTVHRVRDGVTVHRYQGRLHPMMKDGVPVLGPKRTFVDCATLLSVRDLVIVGDWLVAQRVVELFDLRGYLLESHLDGVQRARKAARLVREGSESPKESHLRFLAIHAGLPEPELNVELHDDRGIFLTRGDLVYRRWRVLVEYDGWQHERDADQRQRDHLRRERLETAGWRVIVVTVADLAHPEHIGWRIFNALRARGYTGQIPRFAA